MQQTLFNHKRQVRTLLEVKQEQTVQGLTDKEFQVIIEEYCEKHSVNRNKLLEIIRKKFSQTR